MFSLSLLGFAIFPLKGRTRRRTSILAAAMLVVAVGLAGCNGSSNGGTSATSESSIQKVVALDVTENGNPVTVSGLPVDLGKITKR
jgi:hypothetical protein